MTFPCTFCSDGGRRINIADPEWPTTLQGFAKNAYDFFDKELRPLGYKLHAEIISFPGGMPGEAALLPEMVKRGSASSAEEDRCHDQEGSSLATARAR